VNDFPKIHLNEIEIRNLIGEGGQSKVYMGMWMGTKVAFKQLKTDHLDEERKKQLVLDLMSESQMLKALRHPNIVQFLGFIADPPSFGIVTEYMERGSLYSIIRQVRKHKIEPLSEALKIKLLIEIARGMHYLHSHKPMILHRDLKSLNVLVNSEMQAKIADMGLSRIHKIRGTRVMSMVGTPQWAAPEILKQEKYNEKADIWSYGIIVWELVTYERPYEGKQRKDIILCAKNGETLQIPIECPLFLKKLMLKCWRVPSDTRPSFIKILNSLISYESGLKKPTVIQSMPELPKTYEMQSPLAKLFEKYATK